MSFWKEGVEEKSNRRDACICDRQAERNDHDVSHRSTQVLRRTLDDERSVKVLDDRALMLLPTLTWSRVARRAIDCSRDRWKEKNRNGASIKFDRDQNSEKSYYGFFAGGGGVFGKTMSFAAIVGFDFGTSAPMGTSQISNAAVSR